MLLGVWGCGAAVRADGRVGAGFYARGVDEVGRDGRAEAGAVGLGLRLRALRVQAGKTLARASEGAGVSLSYISDVERGRRSPSLDVLDRVCESYGVLVSEALAGVYPYGSSERPEGLAPPPDGRAS